MGSPTFRNNKYYYRLLTGWFQQSGQAVTFDSHELSFSTSVTLHSQSGLPSMNNLSGNKSVSFYSIQLTQATRPMRRLYVENIPVLASDKSLMECLNDFLLSSGANHIEGTKPCISCIINKEKGQAVVEFLTPEDATSALAFSGKSFSDSILKVRRPKDFVEAVVHLPKLSTIVLAIGMGYHDSGAICHGLCLLVVIICSLKGCKFLPYWKMAIALA
ncbi:splicing factor U2af large subunit A-like [Aristolochia californica]|uniref:splicing factor U2af large subunit A-like n=1 Tax=Aristolochia californica TaxID=171875 RepID=UPI0035D52D4C